MGEAGRDALRVGFEGTIKLEFRGAKVSSDAGLFPHRDIDQAEQLTETGTTDPFDFRSGTNIQPSTMALLRQSVYSRLAGYEDTNDAERLSIDPLMRHVVGGRTEGRNASAPPLPDELELYLLPRRRGRFMLYSRKLLLGQGDEGEAVTDSPTVPEATLWTRAKTLCARLESKRPASEKVLKEVPEVTAVRIHYPASLSREQARTIYNELLETQIQKHKKWLIIDGALLPFSALLTLVPGPNLALAYLAWRTLGHYKGRALGQSMSELEVTFVAVDLLERLQKVVTPFFTFHRARKIRDVARTLKLPGLARVYLKSK